MFNLTDFVLFLGLIVIGFIIYLYQWGHYSYWRAKGISGPTPLPFVGNYFTKYLSTHPDREIALYNKYGRIYGQYVGWQPVLIVADPTVIKDIFVKSFSRFPDRRLPGLNVVTNGNLINMLGGQDWKRIRAIMSPVFATRSARQMYPKICECLTAFIAYFDLSLHTTHSNEQSIDLIETFGRFSLDLIASRVFATDIHVYDPNTTGAQPEHPFVRHMKQRFDWNLGKELKTTLLSKGIQKWLERSQNRDTDRYFEETVRKILESRRQAVPNDRLIHDDFIQLLVDAEAPDSDQLVTDQTSDETDIGRKAISKRLTEDEVVSQADVFISSGFMEKKLQLSYCIYELALNTTHQNRLRREISGAIDDPNTGHIPYDRLQSLPYLDAVLSESMRLHAGAMPLQRIAAMDGPLGNTGISVKAGQLILFNTYAIHHSARHFERPFEFNPDRFMPQNRQNIQPYTYLPFGAGPRNCIAMKYELLVMKACLAQFVWRYQFTRCAQTNIPIQFEPFLHKMRPKPIIVSVIDVNKK